MLVSQVGFKGDFEKNGLESQYYGTSTQFLITYCYYARLEIPRSKKGTTKPIEAQVGRRDTNSNRVSIVYLTVKHTKLIF
jgi:hypothetical protein